MIIALFIIIILSLKNYESHKYNVVDQYQSLSHPKTRKQKILYITQLSFLLAILIIMCFTPMIGTITIIPGSVVATIAFIPVIIGGIVLGPMAGAILGFCAGMCSFIYWTFIEPGNLSAIMFTPFHAFPISSYWTIIICFVPRILTGYGAALFYKYSYRVINNQIVRILFACLIGSLANTLLVLFGTYFTWGEKYAMAYNMNYKQLLSAIFVIIGTNGIMEAVFAMIIGTPISKALLSIKLK